MYMYIPPISCGIRYKSDTGIHSISYQNTWQKRKYIIISQIDVIKRHIFVSEVFVGHHIRFKMDIHYNNPVHQNITPYS